MDSFKKDMKQYRGCFVFIGIMLLLAIFGGVMQLTSPRLGNLAPLAGLGATLVGVALWVGLAKGVRWAKIVAGILLAIVGLGVTAFIIYDFITSFVKGESTLHTSAISGYNYGMSVFIILATGISMIVGGILLIRGKKIA